MDRTGPRPGGTPEALHTLIAAIGRNEDEDIPCARMGHQRWEVLARGDQRRHCGYCPIQPECLAYAESDSSCTGTWGGRQFGHWEKPEGHVRKRP